MEMILMFLFIALQVADAATTYIILKGGGRELNPFMQVVMNFLGVVPALVVMKLLVVGVFMVYAEAIPLWVWMLMVIIYAVVVANNLRAISDMDKLK
jgi:amino acid transporter